METQVKMHRNGRITIPAAMRRELGFDERTILEIDVTEDRELRLTPLSEGDERRNDVIRRSPRRSSQHT